MNLLDLMVRIGVEDEASDRVGSIGDTMLGRLGGAAKAAAAAVAAGVAAVGAGAVAMGKSALDSYATYEQMVGGVDKLFGDASGKLQQYASQAYQTSGMSANQYMQQATSFSAALINSLGGDTARAADMADVAMRAMSDNVNVFGSNAEDVQNAIMGISRQNYTMIDNLKLGYAGTKQGMEQLIADANAWGAANGEASDLSIDSFADCVQAIQQVQEAQGIAGTTAKEAAGTIEGSVNMAKAAWEDYLVGIANPDADMGQLTDQLLTAIGNVAANVGPRVVEIGKAMAEQLPTALAGLADTLTPVVSEALASAWNAAGAVLSGLGIQLPQVDASQVTEGIGAVVGVVRDLADGVGTAMDNVSNAFASVTGTESFRQSVQALSDALGPFKDNVLVPLGDFLTGPFATAVGTVAGILAEGAIQAVTGVMQLATGASQAVQQIVQFLTVDVPGAVQSVGTWFSQLPQSIGAALSSAASSVVSWATGIVSHATSAGSQFVNAVGTFFGQLPGAIGGFLASVIQSVVSWASQMASHATSAGSRFLSGIGSAMTSLPGRIGGFLSSALGKVAAFAGSLATRAVQAGQGFLRGIQSGFQQAVSFVGGIPGRIRGAIGDLGGLLLGAGKGVMDGLLNGLKSGFGAVKDFVGGIADWIKSHKGPIEYDRRLLIPNGMAIMESLAEGLASGFDGGVAPYVRSVAGGISDALSAPFDVSAAGVVDVQSRGVSAAVQQGSAELERWLETRLGPIIERYAPTATPREFGRMVRSYA